MANTGKIVEVKARRLRRAGAPWRVLAHERIPGQRITGEAHDIAVPGTEFDELVVGKWCHIEQMDTGRWWMDIGGVTLWVRADRDGRPVSVDVYGPNDYAEPIEGCAYTLTWDGTDALGTAAAMDDEPTGQETA